MPMPTPGPDLLKLNIVGRRKPGTTLAEHRHHIRHVHGEMVLRYVATAPADAPQRYVQHQVFDGQFRTTDAASDPFALNCDFVTQIWVEDMAALARSRLTPFYLDHLKGDEDNFVDQANVVFMPSREREVVSRGTPTPDVCKLFGFVQKVPGLDDAAFRHAWTSAARTLADGELAARILRHVQNDVIARPGVPLQADGIDEFWVADQAHARTLLSQWRAQMNSTIVAQGLATAAGCFALLAYESVLHAGSG